MKQTILMIEDNPDIVKINRAVLSGRGYRVLAADTLERGWALFERERPDLILLDIMLPDGSGLDFCRRVRERGGAPILFLTALGESQDIVEGLTSGGDDYLPKPYDLDILCARVEALLRRAARNRPEDALMRMGPLEISVVPPRAARLNGAELPLTPRELALLELLMRNRERYLPYRALYEQVWGAPSVDARPVKQHIHNIRRKLGESSPVIIESSQGKGYRLTLRQDRV